MIRRITLAQAERVIYIYITNAPIINVCYMLYAYFFSDNSMHTFPMFSSSLYVLY